MTIASAHRVSAAFVLHALGGALFSAYLLQFLLSPADLFNRFGLMHTNLSQCAVAGMIFYGFSLPLLWQRPLTAGWGTAYAAVSLLSLLLVFTPSVEHSAGMMQRVADPDLDEISHPNRVIYRAVFQFTLGTAFLLVQAAFLRRSLRVATVPPVLPN